MLTDVEIVNEALAMIGEGGINSLDEDVPLARQCKAIYFPKIDQLLSFEWSFNARTYKLTAIAEVADNGYIAADKQFENGWRHAFMLPGTRLGLPRRFLTDPRNPDNPLRKFAIEGNSVYCDEKTLWATVSVRAAPDTWIPSFRLAATKAVAGELCIPVSHDKNLAATLRGEAQGDPEEGGRGGLIGQALAFDAARARTKAPMQTDPFTAARMS